MITSVLHELKTKLLIDTRTQAVIYTYTKTVLQHVNNFVYLHWQGLDKKFPF